MMVRKAVEEKKKASVDLAMEGEETSEDIRRDMRRERASAEGVHDRDRSIGIARGGTSTGTTNGHDQETGEGHCEVENGRGKRTDRDESETIATTEEIEIDLRIVVVDEAGADRARHIVGAATLTSDESGLCFAQAKGLT